MNRDDFILQEAERIRQTRRNLIQFGSEWPSLDALCRYCKKRRGEHYGNECPPKDEN